MYLCTMCMQCLWRTEEGLDALSWSYMAVSSCLGDSNLTQVLWKSNQCSYPIIHLSSPFQAIYCRHWVCVYRFNSMHLRSLENFCGVILSFCVHVGFRGLT